MFGVLVGILVIGFILYSIASVGEVYSEGGCLAVIGAFALVFLIVAFG